MPWMQRIVRLPSYRLVPSQPVLRENSSLCLTLSAACAFVLFAIQPLVDCIRARFSATPSSASMRSSTLSGSSGGSGTGYTLGVAGASPVLGATASRPHSTGPTAPAGYTVDASGRVHKTTPSATTAPSPRPTPSFTADADIENQQAAAIGGATTSAGGVAAGLVDVIVRSAGQIPQARYAPLSSTSDDDAVGGSPGAQVATSTAPLTK
jgi:hypothetical protein